ncbi:MAG: hypothetical protein DSZ28_00110 [Thiothrix sp.]|nr:MAG: hypothetical protein DSZ28_00110 [Thiothrix sp.]
MTYPIRIVVALPAEAKPVISRFRLERIPLDDGFPVYRNKDVSLIISGVGKKNSAAAVRQLQAFSRSMIKASWINFGIAGHPVRALGEGFLARRVIDAVTADNWTVRMGELFSFETDELLTVDVPDFGYKYPYAIDMEAAGYFPEAQALTDAGRVHCLKVVSDNRVSPAKRINKKMVSRLIEDKLDLFVAILDKLDGESHWN